MKTLKCIFAVASCAAVLGLAGCASTPGQNSYFDDSMVTARVKKAIYNEPSLKVTDISVKTDDQLAEQLGELKREAFNLRFQSATGQLEKPARVRQVRRNIARIKTAQTQRAAAAAAKA